MTVGGHERPTASRPWSAYDRRTLKADMNPQPVLPAMLPVLCPCELRKKHGMALRELAKRVGAEFYTVISQLEAGLGRIPPDRYVVSADALGIEPREFVRTVASYYGPVTYDIVFGAGPRSGPRTKRLGGCA